MSVLRSLLLGQTLLLVFQLDLDSLAFLVQVYVGNIASVEGEVLLTHRVGVQCLIHTIGAGML